MSEFSDQVLTDVARLVTTLERRGRRIRKLEDDLRKAQDTLSTMTEFHWQDEVFIRDDLGVKGGKDKEEYSREHMARNGAECLGKRMLEDGYLKVGEVRWRDERYMGTRFRVSIKAIVTKATTRAERQVIKNKG